MTKIDYKPTLIIAGPGAGKTHNMVQSVVDNLHTLSAARYMVIITYTNAASENIKKRLARKITIPQNLFIGTIHAFLNKFIVIPYSSLVDTTLNKNKVFLQCDSKSLFNSFQKANNLKLDVKKASFLKARLKDNFNKRGYISFDQTIDLSLLCIANSKVLDIISNRIQFMFIDEFQDTSNPLFKIIESIRKKKKTKIYCVGDPEQYIQSYDSTSKTFSNITILKAANNRSYYVELNTNNYRSTEKIVNFLNHFNSKSYSSHTFKQESKTGIIGETVKFITNHTDVKSIIPVFNKICDEQQIVAHERCVLVKKNDFLRRITTALNNNFSSPKRSVNTTPLKPISDVLLAFLSLNQSQFFDTYKTDIYTLRKYSIAILKAIQNGTITNQNTLANYITQDLQLEIKTTVPVNIDSLRVYINDISKLKALAVSNIHTIKGLESEAVLAIAKNEEELLLWLETNRTIRETYRDEEKTDYPRLGYVAFSRARKILCISCLEEISTTTKMKLSNLGVETV